MGLLPIRKSPDKSLIKQKRAGQGLLGLGIAASYM